MFAGSEELKLKLKTAKVDYYRYLASREWASLRKLVRQRSGGICERCKESPATQCHHLTYERLGCERLEDLQDLCTPCHEYESAVSTFDPLSPGPLSDIAEQNIRT